MLLTPAHRRSGRIRKKTNKNSEDNKKKETKCCICDSSLEGKGNNAAPYKKGMCCNNCNDRLVIPFRSLLVFC